MQNVPTFLLHPDPQPAVPRVLTDVEPPLMSRCGYRDWYDLNKGIEEFWWNVRYIRAYAFDGKIDGVIRYETRLAQCADWITARLVEYGVTEDMARAWLEAYRQQTDALERREMGEDEETDWRPYDRMAMLS
jgi:hypothetical protein